MDSMPIRQNFGEVVDPLARQDALNGSAAVPSCHISHSSKTRTFVAAENRLLRETLSRLLMGRKELEVVGQSSAFPELAELLRETKTRILLLNSTGSHQEDMCLVRAVRELEEDIRIVMMGMRAEGNEFLYAVRSGVSGYLLLDASTEEVFEAIRIVREGGAACPAKLCLLLFQYYQQEMADFPSPSVREQVGLTRKEQQIIRLVAQGMTNKEMPSSAAFPSRP